MIHCACCTANTIADVTCLDNICSADIGAGEIKACLATSTVRQRCAEIA